MSNFNQAIPVILQHEGGWVHDPADPGGETCYGVSMAWIEEKKLTAQDLGLPNLAPGCLHHLNVDVAKVLYKRYWWDQYGYGSLDDQTVGTKVFDAAINMGPVRAHRLAQLAANDCGVQLVTDGMLGPASIAGINGLVPEVFVEKMCNQMASYYRKLVVQKPALGRFLRDWLHRAAWRG